MVPINKSRLFFIIFSGCLCQLNAESSRPDHGAPIKENAAHSNSPPAPATHAPEPEKSLADISLKRLMAGNKRFISATMAHPNQSVERRMDLAQSQSPFAIIVSCSDSRVPPEILFDQGVGDLFVIRSAGQVVTEVGLGSIEYAVEHLGVNLIMVLGHERCGAVKATLAGGEAPGSIGSIVKIIKPAADKAKEQGGDILNNAIQLNVKMVAEKIAASPVIRHALGEGKLKVVKGVYDLDEGMVKSIP